jgi:sucrose-6-phosphate hydrolase SacC (GH32 family)
MARSKKPPSWSPVAIERDGKAYSGKFYVDGRLLTVLYNGRTKTTQLTGSDAPAIASQLLSELRREK